MSFRITVKPISKKVDQFITFCNVKAYSKDDGMLVFTDPKTGLRKEFPVNDCNVDEEGDETG